MTRDCPDQSDIKKFAGNNYILKDVDMSGIWIIVTVALCKTI